MLVKYLNLLDTIRKTHCSVVDPFQPYIGCLPLWAEVTEIHPIINVLIPLIPTHLLIATHRMIKMHHIHGCPNISVFVLICDQYCGAHSTCFVELSLEVPNDPTPVTGVGHSKSIDQHNNVGTDGTLHTLLGYALAASHQTTPLRDQHRIPAALEKVSSTVGLSHPEEHRDRPEIPACLRIFGQSVSRSHPCSPDRTHCEQTTSG